MCAPDIPAADPASTEQDPMSRVEDRMRRCITMAMCCLDPLSNEPDERLAWYRLKDALDGKEPRNCLTYDLDPRCAADIIRDGWPDPVVPPANQGGSR
jgi:hypothetical protein